MTKEALIKLFFDKHNEFLAYINTLPDVEFMISKNHKWTPGQQLDHIYLCLQPLAQALASKAYIEQKFGLIKRPFLSYNEVIANYDAALKKGGKAPERFVPKSVELDQKPELLTLTHEMIKAISDQLTTYTETELDTLALPHPLLGLLTVKEMFYLMAHHATHHLDQTKQNLKN
jgi:hypothetical protein